MGLGSMLTDAVRIAVWTRPISEVVGYAILVWDQPPPPEDVDVWRAHGEIVAPQLGGPDHMASQGGMMANTPKKSAEPKPEAHDPAKLPGTLRRLGGSMSHTFNNVLANQAMSALWLKNSD